MPAAGTALATATTGATTGAGTDTGTGARPERLHHLWRPVLLPRGIVHAGLRHRQSRPACISVTDTKRLGPARKTDRRRRPAPSSLSNVIARLRARVGRRRHLGERKSAAASKAGDPTTPPCGPVPHRPWPTASGRCPGASPAHRMSILTKLAEPDSYTRGKQPALRIDHEPTLQRSFHVLSEHRRPGNGLGR